MKTFEIWINLYTKENKLVAHGTSPLGTFEAESIEDARTQIDRVSIKEIKVEYIGTLTWNYILIEVEGD